MNYLQNTPWSPVLGLTAGAALLCVGCGGMTSAVPKTEEDGAARAAIRVAIPVEVQKPVRGHISAYFESRTRIEAEADVEVASQGSGRCLEVMAEEGDKVSQGDVLARLDKEEAEANYRQNQIQVQKQKIDYERAKEAYQAGLMPQADYESARFAYEQGQASLEVQRVQLENLTITAPISGIVSDRTVQVGQLVSSGTPVFKIVDPETFKIVIKPPEKDLHRLRMGQEAEVTVDALPDEVFVAHVSRINPAVDPVSGTIKVTLTFGKGQPVEKLLASAFSRVRLVMDTHEDALLLPKDAVVEENARKYVYVVEPMESGDAEAAPAPAEGEAAVEPEERLVARRVEVQIGFEDANQVEVLEGVEADSVVVVLGQYNLKDNAEVRVTSAESEINARLDMTPEEALAKSKEERITNTAQRVRKRDRL